MNNVSKTLYIPLYGKAQVSRRGILLRDPDAEAIWEKEGFPLKGKSASKWLALYMGMRSAVFDCWLREKLREDSEAIVIHPGCGLDSRINRVGCEEHRWYDLDFPAVIAERRRYFSESAGYRMIGCDFLDESWLREVPKGGRCILVMEGITMYLHPVQLRQMLRRLSAHFSSVTLLMDVYSSFAARASRYKNPINDVGVTQVYGLDDPDALADGTGLHFLQAHDMTPDDLTGQLQGVERHIFRSLYAGRFARKLYKLWEFCSEKA